MKLSILIPFKQDFEEITPVVQHLIDTAEDEDYEILIYNDGSVHGSGKPRLLELDMPHVRVINNTQSFGVGHGFDRMAENAKGENLILMGADVTPHKGWHSKVLSAVNSRPESIGCAVCVGDKPPYGKRYGADMLFTMGNDDLPPESKLRERKGGYTCLFQGKWAKKKNAEVYDISCLMGAFYFVTKDWYQKIGGFDTEYRNKYAGHRVWGSLEPMISLKSWLCGGGCYLDTNIEATHIFNRANPSKGARSAEWMFWNQLWVLETMVLNDFTRNRIADFMHAELNWGVAKKMIKDNYKTIEKYRETNRERFKLSLQDYMTRFDIKIREYKVY